MARSIAIVTDSPDTDTTAGNEKGSISFKLDLRAAIVVAVLSVLLIVSFSINVGLAFSGPESVTIAEPSVVPNFHPFYIKFSNPKNGSSQQFFCTTCPPWMYQFLSLVTYIRFKNATTPPADCSGTMAVFPDAGVFRLSYKMFHNYSSPRTYHRVVKSFANQTAQETEAYYFTADRTAYDQNDLRAEMQNFLSNLLKIFQEILLLDSAKANGGEEFGYTKWEDVTLNLKKTGDFEYIAENFRRLGKEVAELCSCLRAARAKLFSIKFGDWCEDQVSPMYLQILNLSDDRCKHPFWKNFNRNE